MCVVNKLFNSNSKFWRAMDFLATMFLINCMWLAGCLPIITAGASTTAMCQTFFRIYAKREERLTVTFWKGFKTSLKQATMIWLVYLVFFLDVVLVIWSKRQYGVLPAWAVAKPVLALAAVLALAVAFTAVYIFAIIAYYDCTIKQALVNALGISSRYPGRTLLLVLLTGITAVLVYVAPFLTLIVPAACSALQCKITRNLFLAQEDI